MRRRPSLSGSTRASRWPPPSQYQARTAGTASPAPGEQPRPAGVGGRLAPGALEQLARGEARRDLVGNAATDPAPLAHPLEQRARHRARECRLTVGDAVQEGCDALGGLALEQVTRCSCAD